MVPTGFSWPSATPVWRLRYTSPRLIGVGVASSARIMARNSGASGTRILSPLTSAAVCNALFFVVKWRTP